MKYFLGPLGLWHYCYNSSVNWIPVFKCIEIVHFALHFVTQEHIRQRVNWRKVSFFTFFNTSLQALISTLLSLLRCVACFLALQHVGFTWSWCPSWCLFGCSLNFPRLFRYNVCCLIKDLPLLAQTLTFPLMDPVEGSSSL